MIFSLLEICTHGNMTFFEIWSIFKTFLVLLDDSSPQESENSAEIKKQI